MRTRFYGKTWTYWAGLIVMGSLTIFSVWMGIGVLTGATPTLRPESDQVTGKWLILCGLLCALLSTLPLFAVLARRKPILQLNREGIAIRVISRTSLDRVPLMPRWLKTVWGLVTVQAFRIERVRVQWDRAYGASVEGLPMMRRLVIQGDIETLPPNADSVATAWSNHVEFSPAAFRDPLDQIVSTLHHFFQYEHDRDRLSSWAATN